MQILILKTIQNHWLYINPNAIMALHEEYNGTTLNLITEISDSAGRKSKTFTVTEDLESMMKLIKHASSC